MSLGMRNILAPVFGLAIFCHPAMAERLSVDEMTLFVMQCENTINQRLSDPQSYNRQSVSELVVTKGSLAEFMGIDTPEKAAIVARGNEISEELRGLRMTLAELYVAGGYERIAVTIIFDHRSASGEQTREASVGSEYVNEGMAWAEVGGHNVAVDGLTNMNWQEIKTDRMTKELEAATAEALSGN